MVRNVYSTLICSCPLADSIVAATDQEITKLKTVLRAFELGLQALISAVDRKRLPSTEEDVHDVMQAEFASLTTGRA